jgi:hypothetical protein
MDVMKAKRLLVFDHFDARAQGSSMNPTLKRPGTSRGCVTTLTPAA